MKSKSISADERREREEQIKAQQAAQWIQIHFANGHKRMMKRKDYEALQN